MGLSWFLRVGLTKSDECGVLNLGCFRITGVNQLRSINRSSQTLRAVSVARTIIKRAGCGTYITSRMSRAARHVVIIAFVYRDYD